MESMTYRPGTLYSGLHCKGRTQAQSKESEIRRCMGHTSTPNMPEVKASGSLCVRPSLVHWVSSSPTRATQWNCLGNWKMRKGEKGGEKENKESPNTSDTHYLTYKAASSPCDTSLCTVQKLAAPELQPSVSSYTRCYFRLPGFGFPRSLTSPLRLSRATLPTHFPTPQLLWISNNFLKLLKHTFKHASFISVKICARKIKSKRRGHLGL